MDKLALIEANLEAAFQGLIAAHPGHGNADPEIQAKIEESRRIRANGMLEILVDGIESKDVFLVRWLIPNKADWTVALAREVFTQATGIKLPRKKSDTKEAVLDFIGREKYAKHVQDGKEAADKRRAEREAEAAAREAEQTKRNAEADARTEEKIRTGEQVSGAELVRSARRAGLVVHARTAGTLLRRVEQINGEAASVKKTKGGRFAVGAKLFQLYNELREVLNKKEKEVAL